VPLEQPKTEYREGRAEATGLPDGVADLVLAARRFTGSTRPGTARSAAPVNIWRLDGHPEL